MRNVWKSLNVISIFVLTSVNIISPLTYAQLEDFSVQENISTNDARIITPDGEEIIQGTEAWEQYINSLDILDGENEMVDDFIEEPQDEEEPQEKSELDIARESLNAKPLILIKYFKELGIIVKVKALAGSFPEGTYIDILSVQGDEQAQVKEQIVNDPNNDISEEDDVIAFDIKFVYTLSDGTGVEVQPRENTVEVTFDYERNEELREADQSEDQEIQIYHIDDKDENGEKVAKGEEIVEKMNINATKSENLENGVVIDAESFSVYTIVVQRRELGGTNTWQYGRDYYTISIARPSGLSATDYPIAGFTIMDRNLGATAVWNLYTGSNGNASSYGYMYQWGNNYGIPYSASASSVLSNTGLTWSDSYNNSGYVYKKFVNGGNFSGGVWSDKTGHNGVWGGENDLNFGRSQNTVNKLYWDDGGDRNLRQGPCPAGWHVPSAGEWSMLIDYWYYTNYGTHASKRSPYTSSKLYNLCYLSDSAKRNAFMIKFKLPFAGYRGYRDASIVDQGSHAVYWSSSPSMDSNGAYGVYLDYYNVSSNTSQYTAGGSLIRCFKNEYVASTSTTNLVDTQTWVEGIDFETITISDPNDITKGFTIMDRNLGATTSVISTTAGIIASTGSYGFKYQWGNNYGFPQFTWTNSDSDVITSSAITVSSTAGATWNDIYNNHGYYGTTFVKSKTDGTFGYDYWTVNARHNNLRGGENDINFVSSPNSVNGLYWDDGGDRSLRQGPCPVGYHIPSAGEWSKLVEYWGEYYRGKGGSVSVGKASNLSKILNNSTAREDFMTYFKIPLVGMRDYSNATIRYLGDVGYYWTSSPNDSSNSDYARYFVIDSSNVRADVSYFRAPGYSLRCFKNAYVAPKVITYNPNWGAFSGMALNATKNIVFTKSGGNYIPDINIQIPNREGYMFDGWYTSNTIQDASTEWLGMVTDSTTVTQVYAKWLPFYDLAIAGTNYIIMDRNLGATAVWNYGDSLTSSKVGKYYQWGNNYGFKNSGTLSYTSSSQVVNNTDTPWGPGNYYYSATYIKRATSPFGWDAASNANLWGGSGTTVDSTTSDGAGTTQKGRQGPCPLGYHIPSVREWKAIISALNTTSSSTVQSKLKLPLAGFRETYDGTVYSQGSMGDYWSSSRNGSDNAYRVYLDSSDINSAANASPSYAFPIRCMKSYSVAYHPNGGAFSGMTVNATKKVFFEQSGSNYIPDINIQFPNRTGYMFDGWYTSSSNQVASTEWTGYFTPSTTVTQVYAKWLPFEELIITGTNYIIMDRNLGATAAWNYGYSVSTTNKGKYYQWGNNYGFKNSGTLTYTSTNQVVNNTDTPWGPGNYYSSSTFIKSSGGWDAAKNPNLWGGSGTTVDSITSDGVGTTDKGRQGPCPVGYHIPSTKEWKDIIGALGVDGSTSAGVAILQTMLKLPFAGNRNKTTTNIEHSNYGFYWSSSHGGSDTAYILIENTSGVNPQYNADPRSNGYSLRCFKNRYKIIYDPNGGAFSGMAVNATKDVFFVERNGTYIPDINIQFPNKEGYMFDGWYTSNTNQVASTEWTGYVTDNTTVTQVYAKWLPFQDLDLNFNGTKFTIMDRNLGASEEAEGTYNNGTPESLNKLGKYYQWGNNYGFDNSTSPWSYISITQVDATGYGPGNYYSSATFITRQDSDSSFTWDETDNTNLWGGTGTTGDKQGPCPVGYHVPSSGEWQHIYGAFNTWISTTEGTAFCNIYGGVNSKCFAAKLQLPFAGYRSRGDSNVSYQGSSSYYLSSTRNSSDGAYVLRFNSSDIFSWTRYYSSSALSVRCFKNEPNPFLSFDATTNGGTTTLSPIAGSTFNISNLSTYPATRAGYTFVGWNENPNATTGQSSVTLTHDVTVYAIFKKTITITFNKNGNTSQTPNGGSASTATSINQTCDMYNNDTSCSITSPTIGAPSNTPTVLGYSAGSTNRTITWNQNTAKTVSANATYYAQTTKAAETRKITFNPNGNTSFTYNGTTKTATTTYDLCTISATYNGTAQDSSCSATITMPTISAHSNTPTVVGWSTAAETHTASYTAGQSSVNLTASSDLTYYAQTKKAAVTRKITFNPNGNTSFTYNGTTKTATTTYDLCTISATYNGTAQDSSCSATITMPTISAHSNTPTVVGWSTAAGTHTASYTAGQTNVTLTASSDLTYYAQTKKAAVTLTAKWNANGSSLSSTTNSTCELAATYNGIAQATSCTVDAPTITRSGWSIVGFNTSATSKTNHANYNTSTKKLTLTSALDNSTWYAQTSKEVSATFKPNGNKLDNGTVDVVKSCTRWNTEATCSITTPTITNSTTPTVVGYTTSEAGVASASIGSNASHSIEGGETYYAHTKKTAVTLTAKWNANGATLSSTADKTCTLAEVYDGTNQATSCTVDAPTITACENTPIIVGFNTGANSTSNNSSYNTSTKKLTLTEALNNKTWYVITKKEAVTYTVNFDSNGNTISSTSVSKTIPATYNCVAQETSTGAICPKITAPSGFTSIGYSSGAGIHDAGVCTSQGLITLNESNNETTAYAHTQSDQWVYEAIYNRDLPSTTDITAGTASCSTTITYNGEVPTQSCNVTLGTITCRAASGYTTPKWNGVYSEGQSVTISGNTIFTGACIDTTSPICTWGEPSNICISGGVAGIIKLTCTDGVGINQTRVRGNDIIYNTGLLVLGDSDVVNGMLTSKTYTFTYTGKVGVDGMTGFTLKADVVRDTSNNGNVLMGPSTVVEVDNTGPNAPILKSVVTPTNDTTPTLKWNAVASDNGCSTVEGYEVRVCNSPDCASYTRNSIVANTSWEVSSALPNTDGTTYYWKVRAKDALGNWGEWSDVGSFVLDTTAPGSNGSHGTPLPEYVNSGTNIEIPLDIVEVVGMNTSYFDENDIHIYVGGVEKYPNKTLVYDSVNAGVYTYTLALSNLTGDGALQVVVPAESFMDNAGNQNNRLEWNNLTTVDNTLPTYALDSSSTLKSSIQRLTGVCLDSEGITQYYIGNNSTPIYTTITSTGSFTTGIDITSAGTYYLYCKDAAGNLVSGSKIYDTYIVHNMLEAITGMDGNYNESNYAEVSSGIYIAPRGTLLSLGNIYTVPYNASVDTYRGYSTNNSVATPDTSIVIILDGNSTYYTWFDRQRYILDLIINKGINSIKYKVNDVDSYSSTQSTLENIEIKAGAQIRAYAVAKSGYAHTETSLDNPWIVVVTGNNVFSPIAETNTDTPYTVFHYVKIAGEDRYLLSKTEELSGTTDEYLTLSSLAKESELLCAHYSSGSLTGTESGPGEIITQTTIKGDGSTVIYLYYTRNTRTVTLSGDAHIQMLEGDDAVRECGSEVPVNAIPKPGYHFVRWDREEDRKEEENVEIPGL